MGDAGCCICSFVISILLIIVIFIIKYTLYGDINTDYTHYDYHYYDDDNDGIGPGGGKYSNSFIFGGGGKGAVGGGGSRFGGSRGGGNCFSDTTYVWTKNETMSDFTAHHLMVKHLREGDLVGTLDVSPSKNQHHRFMWTRATDVSIYEGTWTSHSIVFQNDLNVTVTSPHLMIISKNAKLYFIRADHVKVGDEMWVNDKQLQVTSITNRSIRRKVAIETEDGTLQVNGVWTAGFCDDNIEAENRIIDYQTMIEDYKLRHFGNEYSNMCMDEIAWKIAYKRNNEFSENIS